MDAILPENLSLVFYYLEPTEKLKLAITGEKYSCDSKKKLIEKIRKKTLRILCANSLTTMFNFGDEGILFDDKTEMMEDMNEMSNYTHKEKVKRIIEIYCTWISRFIIKKYNYNEMCIGSEDIIYHRNRARYIPDKFAYSPWSFNHELDQPVIKNPNKIWVSMVYRVRTIGIQYKTIKGSLQLKALVG
jgi:hypothetical protein